MNSKYSQAVNPLIPIYAGVMLFGSLCGAILLSLVNTELGSQLTQIVAGFVTIRQQGDLSSIIISCGTMNLILVSIIMFSGYCSVGLPIILFSSFFKGLSYGIMTGLIYCYYTSPFCYITLTMLPFCLVSAAIIILTCKNATKQSLLAFRKGDSQERALKAYNLQCLLAIGGICMISAAEGLVVLLIGRLFHL